MRIIIVILQYIGTTDRTNYIPSACPSASNSNTELYTLGIDHVFVHRYQQTETKHSLSLRVYHHQININSSYKNIDWTECVLSFYF